MEVDKDITTTYHFSFNDAEFRVLQALVAEGMQSRKMLPEGSVRDGVSLMQLEYWWTELENVRSR